MVPQSNRRLGVDSYRPEQSPADAVRPLSSVFGSGRLAMTQGTRALTEAIILAFAIKWVTTTFAI